MSESNILSHPSEARYVLMSCPLCSFWETSIWRHQAFLLTLGLCCRGQQEAPPERAPYKPEGAPWRAALSEHAASNSTVGGLTGAALLKEWQQLQETAKKPRWCAVCPPGHATHRIWGFSPFVQQGFDVREK